MTGAQRRGKRWVGVFLAAALILAARPSLHAQEGPDTGPSPSATSFPYVEPGSPDAPPPQPKPSAPAPPAQGEQPQRQTRKAHKRTPARADRRQPAATRLAPAGQAPAAEAPAEGGPSGAGGWESATPEGASSGRAEIEQPVEEEAPALGGPSGALRQAAEEETGPGAPWWTRVPNVQPFPPPGNTIVPPRGEGFYTFWELLTGDRRQGPPVYPYPRFGIMMFSFYNADWRYLDRGNPLDHDYLDFLKRIRPGDNFMFTTGGEWRTRYNNEVDSRLSGQDNVFTLTRTRVYGDLWFRDLFRIYGEFINAQSFDQDLPPQPVDQYNPNFLNLFADAKLGTLRDQPLWLRVGRQELLYGSQRLISPLDWANTRRTFQGVKLFWQNAKLSLDGFVVQPVAPSANSFASVVWQQVFSGVWGTYRPIQGEVIDLYYLDFQDSTFSYSGANGVKGPQNTSTVGSRWYGNKNDWLWDTEGMIQFGRYSNQGLMANAYTMGGGYYFSRWRMNPSLWVYYDHASGQPGPPGNSNVHQTFNQLFPFGHYYFGMTDLVGRQNINDFHTDLSFFPLKWWTVWLQCHVLRLDSPFDALYNSAGSPTRIDPTGRAGINVGEVLTVINNFTVDLHQNIFVQYSHLYAGDFIRRTGSSRSPDALYLMYSYRW